MSVIVRVVFVFKSLSEAELFVFVTMSCCNDLEVPKKKNRRW